MAHIHIILADDDPDDCLIFSQVAKELKEEVNFTCVESCKALMQFLDSSALPNIIFLDLNMPMLSGQECLKKIKQHEIWKGIPIVIYSTASRQDIIDQCYMLGANLYIVKPTSADKLRDIISWIISRVIRLPN